MKELVLEKRTVRHRNVELVYICSIIVLPAVLLLPFILSILYGDLSQWTTQVLVGLLLFLFALFAYFLWFRNPNYRDAFIRYLQKNETDVDKKLAWGDGLAFSILVIFIVYVAINMFLRK